MTTNRIKAEELRPDLIVRERASGRLRVIRSIFGEGRFVRAELHALERAPGCPTATTPLLATILHDYEHAIAPAPESQPVSDVRPVERTPEATNEVPAQALVDVLGRIAVALETIAAAPTKGRTLQLFDNVRTA